jgi:hypothetical protein
MGNLSSTFMGTTGRLITFLFTTQPIVREIRPRDYHLVSSLAGGLLTGKVRVPPAHFLSSIMFDPSLPGSITKASRTNRASLRYSNTVREYCQQPAAGRREGKDSKSEGTHETRPSHPSIHFHLTPALRPPANNLRYGAIVDVSLRQNYKPSPPHLPSPGSRSNPTPQRYPRRYKTWTSPREPRGAQGDPEVDG